METEGGALLLDLRTNTYFSLSATGLVVWNVVVGGGGVSAAVTALCEQFDVTPEAARSDVEDLLGNLRDRGLLEAGTAAGA